MPLNFILEIGKMLIKRTAQPSSLAGLTALLAVFFSQQDATMISEGLQNIIIGLVGISEYFPFRQIGLITMDLLNYLDYPQTALLMWLVYRHLTLTTKLENDISWIKEKLEK